tara:strand:+ start:629 stop:850 length:222 start_codon:yes stop_codon:yes gene_type:complete
MKNKFFHNNKSIIKNTTTNYHTQTTRVNSKLNVDINKLLNRVKNDTYREKKSKIIFFSSVTLILIFIGFFLAF